MSAPDRAEFRPIPVGLMNDPRYQRLTGCARLVLLSLKTQGHAAGIVVIPALRAAVSEWTQFDVDLVTQALDDLIREGWIRVEGSVVWIIGQLNEGQWMVATNPKHRAFIRRYCDSLPPIALVSEFRAHHRAWFEVVPMPDPNTSTDDAPLGARDIADESTAGMPSDTLCDTLFDTLTDRVSNGYPIPIRNTSTSTSTSTTTTPKAAAARERAREGPDPETQPDADPLREQELLALIPVEQRPPILAMIAHPPPRRRKILIASMIGYLHGQGIAGGRAATPIDLAQACQEYLADARSANSEDGFSLNHFRRFVEKCMQQRLQGVGAITSPTTQQEAAQLFELIRQHGLARVFGSRRADKLAELERTGVIPSATHVAELLARCGDLAEIIGARTREQAERHIAESLARSERPATPPALRVVS